MCAPVLHASMQCVCVSNLYMGVFILYYEYDICTYLFISTYIRIITKRNTRVFSSLCAYYSIIPHLMLYIDEKSYDVL